MTVDRAALEALGRDALMGEARARGVVRPDVMTRMEMVDEILRLSTPNPVERKKVRGFLGIARDLIASVVDKGLHLPDAAAFIRGDVRYEPLRAPQPPVATVTLAEIYRAQGHFDRALATLDEVLANEPDLDVALDLRARFAEELARRPKPARAPFEPPEEPAEPEEPKATRLPIAALTWDGPSSVRVCFDLPSGDAPVIVRIVEMRPRPRGADRVERELPCDGRRGVVAATELEPGSIVRAAVGIRNDGTFRALSVAAEVEARDGAWEITWVPRRGVDRALLIRTMASFAEERLPVGA